MTRSASLRAQLASQLESLETVCRLARTREQLGQHAEQSELAEVWFTASQHVKRVSELVLAIGRAER